MEYKIYKLQFSTAVHFGVNALDDCEFTMCADSFFSAMCIEFLNQSEEKMNIFVENVKAGKVIISDLFPFIDDTYYIPKPMIKIENNESDGDSVIKKAYKKLKYISVDKFEEYLNGNMDVQYELDKFNLLLGKKELRTNVTIRNYDEATPYRVGSFRFNKNSGLYIIVGYEDEEYLYEIEDCLISLGFSGIGGERSSGYGRYELGFGKLNRQMEERLKSDKAGVYMTLSVSLPKECEMDSVLDKCEYVLVKRSGFISSNHYVNNIRKKDIYLFQSGACVSDKFTGDVYDVSEGNIHPVYKYAKPLFLEVMP